MAVRRLRMLTTGPDCNYSPGQVLIIDAVQADVLVTANHAVYVDGYGDAEQSPVSPSKSKRKGVR